MIDKLLATDKLLHISFGYIIANVVVTLTGSLVLGLLACAIIAAAKEWRDSKGFGTPEVLDFAVTVVGGLFGALITKL